MENISFRVRNICFPGRNESFPSGNYNYIIDFQQPLIIQCLVLTAKLKNRKEKAASWGVFVPCIYYNYTNALFYCVRRRKIKNQVEISEKKKAGDVIF